MSHGSIAGSLGPTGVGSSVVDTLIRSVLTLPSFILGIIASAGADLGSTVGQLG